MELSSYLVDNCHLTVSLRGLSLWPLQEKLFSGAPSAAYQDTAAAKSLQSCPTLCDPTDISPSGSRVPGILQARTLEWVAISFSNVWKWKVKVKSLSRVRLFATPWTAAYQAPPSVGFSRQEHWSGVPLPSPIGTLVLSSLRLILMISFNLKYLSKALSPNTMALKTGASTYEFRGDTVQSITLCNVSWATPLKTL